MRMTSALAALLLMCAMGCGNHTAVKGVLDSAEAIMNERPDSALVLLENIDSAAVRGRATAARYSLLLSMALDKNVIDTADISIILPAVRYYERRGDDLSKARTFFYYGRVLQNGGDNEAALEAVSKAELYADRTDDLYLQGLIADCKGKLHEAQEEFDSASQYYKKTLSCFRDIGHIRNQMYTADKLSGLYAMVNNETESMAYAIHARDLAEAIPDTTEIISMTISIALAYNISKDYTRALEVLTDACDKYLEGEIPPSYYLILGLTYFSLNDISKASYYSKKAIDYSEISGSGYLGATALLSKIEYASGNYKQSYDYLDKCLGFLAEQNRLQYDESIYEADRRYKNKELMNLVLEKEQYIKNVSTSWALSIFAIACLCLALIQTWRRRMTEKNTEIQEYRNKIRAMQEYSSFLEEIKNSVPEKNELISNQLEILTELMNILVHSQSDLKISEYRKFQELTRESNTETMIGIFRSSFESKYPGIIEKLYSKYDGLVERETDLYILTCLGCSASVIAYIFKTTEGYVYNLRSLLRKKMNVSENGSFVSHLKKYMAADFTEKHE